MIILNDKHVCFRRNRSCESQLIRLCGDFGPKRTDGRRDHGKAFDVVPHNRLMLKLDHYGIRGPTYEWISNFLMHRRHGSYRRWNIWLGQCKICSWSVAVLNVYQWPSWQRLAYRSLVHPQLEYCAAVWDLYTLIHHTEAVQSETGCPICENWLRQAK